MSIVLVEGMNRLDMAMQPVAPAARIVDLTWHTPPPFPPNQRQRLVVKMQNLVAYPYEYRLVVPDADYPEAVFTFQPNQTIEHTLLITTGSPGSYSFAAALYHGNILLDSVSISYTVEETEVPLGGEITSRWLIWHEGLPSWEIFSSGREVPLGSEVYVAVQWLNRSEVSVRGYVDLLVVTPSGSPQTLSATANQGKSAVPGDGWYVQFSPFTAVEAGTYTLRAWLAVNGESVDQRNMILKAAQAI